jgi:hypothetical protein
MKKSPFVLTQTHVKSSITFLLVLTLIILYQNCGAGGGGGGGSTGDSPKSDSPVPAGLGTFVDDPVAGIAYTTSSGLSGVTDSLGQFQFNPGDTVTFYALGVTLGSATPAIGDDGSATVTPVDLVPSSGGSVTDPQVTAIAQILSTLNSVSTLQSNSSTGVFVMPTDSGQLQGLQIPSSGSTAEQQQAFADQLLALLQQAFPTLTIAVTSPSTAQQTLTQGLSDSAFINTVWRAECVDCEGGAYLFLQSNGTLKGFTYDGKTLTGTWTATSTSSATVHLTDPDGTYVDGTMPGQGTVVAEGESNTTVLFSKLTSTSTVANSSMVGYWYVAYTPNAYGNSIGEENGGCANLMAGPSNFYGVLNSGQYISGALSSTGTGSASFNDGNGTNTINFSLGTMTGTVSEGGQVKGTLAFSRNGSCARSQENYGDDPYSSPYPTSSPNPSSNPTPTSTPSPTSSPSPIPSPTPGGVSNILIHYEVSWANTPTSASSIGFTVSVYNSSFVQVGFANVFPTSGNLATTGTPSTTMDNVSISFSPGTGASYQATLANGSSSCSITGGGSGSVGADGTNYPYLYINCP